MQTDLQRLDFNSILQGKDYLFHVHTNYTDGHSKVEEYCSFAVEEGFRSVVIVEHIRRNPTYSFHDLREDVWKARDKYPGLQVSLGVETKVMPDGSLDIMPEIVDEAEVLGIACHSFSGDGEQLTRALAKAFRHYAGEHPACVWLHPSSILRYLSEPRSEQAVRELIDIAVDCGVFVEWNLARDTVSEISREWIPESNLVIGANAHSVAELRDLYSIGTHGWAN
jgi:histidinol phosphatase-like PHP family hydrolase